MKNLVYRILLFAYLLAPLDDCMEVHAEDKNGLTQIGIKALNLTLAQQYEEAIPFYEQMLATLQQQKSTPDVIAVWQKGLAMCKLYLGKTGEAEKLYLETIQTLSHPQYENTKVVRQLYDALSVLYVQMQNYDKATLFSEKAKYLYEKNKDFGDGYVQCLSNAATIQVGKGYHTLAKMIIDVALRLAKKNLNDTVLIDDTVYGIAATTNNDSLLQNAYIRFRVFPYISILNNASMIYHELGYEDEAIKVLKDAVHIMEIYDLSEPLIYNNLGVLFLGKSKFATATEWFRKSYQLCRIPSDVGEVGMNTALGLFLSSDSSVSEFCTEFSFRLRRMVQDMFAFMSGEERAIYWKHFEDYLPMLNRMIIEKGNSVDFGTIYDNILESKGLLLRSTNAVRDAILRRENETDKGDYKRIQHLRKQILVEKNAETIMSLSREIEEIEKRLIEHANAYAGFLSSKSIYWKNVQHALSDDDVAIEFFTIPLSRGTDIVDGMDGETTYCAITLRKGYEYPHIVPLFNESRLEEIDQEDFYGTDSIWYLIWHPLEKELNGVKNIYFSADRELNKIGFEYAPIGNGKIIGDRYNLYRLSSTRLLVEKREQRRTEKAVLYGGLHYDVDKEELIAECRKGTYRSSSLSRACLENGSQYSVAYLPGTLNEVEETSQYFIHKPRVMTGIHGTEESFKSLSDSLIDIIHLATHGFFWNEDEAKRHDYMTFLTPINRIKRMDEDKALMRSGLFFSGANIVLKGNTLPDDIEDGVLTALELSNMNLCNVDLVVMSACGSGLGEISGEGVFGLQRGFKLAGVNTLLMSLWDVDDAATQFLMTEFYRHYLSGKSKHESLKLAQQSLRNSRDYSDPKYWACFILLDGVE